MDLFPATAYWKRAEIMKNIIPHVPVSASVLPNKLIIVLQQILL
jgi:hypothetical protein